MADGPLFPSLDADSLEDAVSTVTSLCMSCGQNGETRLLLTRVPFFKDVIVSSFSCSLCGYSNRGVLPATAVEERGVRFELQVRTIADLQRQMVIYEGSELRLPSLDSVFPFSEGRLTTVEGALTTVRDNIMASASAATADDAELGHKLVQFAARLGALLTGDEAFELHLDDPRGSSFVENLHAPDSDPLLRVVHYPRTAEQDERLGVVPAEEEEEEEESPLPQQNGLGGPAEEEEEEEEKEVVFDPKKEAVAIPVNCPQCSAPCLSRMKLVDIPHFKEVVLMATDCDACGYRENEVKGGGGIEPKGRRLNLHVTGPADLSRDVLKSDMAALRVPELELEATHGTLGGKFTTVEGLLTAMRDQLRGTNPFLFGDSAAIGDGVAAKLKRLVGRIDEILTSETLDYHLVIDDPSGNSHIQNLCAPDPDPQLIIEDFERSAHDDELLGIDEMRTENYEHS